jgi:glycerophosphoryl diester phosphodiesterase
VVQRAVLLLAHRGASADAPENTIAAFREAVGQGADGVEFDAQICGSGEVVVCHDERLTRLAHLDWELARTPFWKLQRADVGTPLGFAPARIPLLEEVIEALPDDFLINVELKSHGVEDHGLSASVVALIRQLGIGERVIVSSFNPFCLWRTADLDASLRRGFLIDPEKGFAWQSSVIAPLVSNHSIHAPFRACTPERVAAWAKLGVRVACWTVDDPDAARTLGESGVAYCITNRPRTLRDGLRGREAR